MIVRYHLSVWFFTALVLSILLVSAPGCRSASPGFVPLSPGSQEVTWTRLIELRESFPGARAYTKIELREGELRRAFNARVQIDAEGRILIEGLTPLGTTAFSLFGEEDAVVIINELKRSAWSGKLSEAGPHVRLFAGAASARDLGLLLLGLPPPGMDQTRVVVGEAGLSEVRLGDEALILVRYEPPSFPPRRVIVAGEDPSDVQRVTLQIIELERATQTLQAPAIPTNFARASDPGDLLDSR